MPDRVDADRYAAAASPLYRLGRTGADTFAQALELAGSMSGTAADINYILSTDAGRTALEIAYTQGKGERMLYAEKMAGLGGALGSESTSGRGEVYAKGTMRQESDPASQIISLNAAATGTDAVLKNVLQNDPGVRAYVDTETAGSSSETTRRTSSARCCTRTTTGTTRWTPRAHGLCRSTRWNIWRRAAATKAWTR